MGTGTKWLPDAGTTKPLRVWLSLGKPSRLGRVDCLCQVVQLLVFLFDLKVLHDCTSTISSAAVLVMLLDVLVLCVCALSEVVGGCPLTILIDSAVVPPYT